MCQILRISRSRYYSYKVDIGKVDPLAEKVKDIFRDNKKTYGTRRIKSALERQGYQVSRRRIMACEGLVSVYTKAQYKVHKTQSNDSSIQNELNREFKDRNPLEAIVSDLTYVRFGNSWNYICTIMDLHNREIIGYSTGPNKDAQLVYKAFSSIKHDLSLVGLFHTDRGREFINTQIDELLYTFDIKRSLSHKGTPYDNAVAKANFKSLKFEFLPK
jgi:putative transposase